MRVSSHAGLGHGPDKASEDDSDGDDEDEEEGDGTAKGMRGSGQHSDGEADGDDEEDEGDEDSDGELMEVERKALKLDRARCGPQGLSVGHRGELGFIVACCTVLLRIGNRDCVCAMHISWTP